MRLGLAARPAAGERMAIDRAAALAELTGARLLLDRITTAEGLSALQSARSKGLEIAATAPITHFIFNEVDTASYDARYRLDPPLRSEADRDALIEALNTGAIDAIVSDHRACTGEAKGHPFPEAEAGAATLEALLPALCSLVADERVELIDALRAVTSGPADLLGLPQGRLDIGAPADLVAFNPDQPNVYGRDGLSCEAPSAFENRRLVGKVLITFVNGAIINQPTG
jgi:dihydroorotase